MAGRHFNVASGCALPTSRHHLRSDVYQKVIVMPRNLAHVSLFHLEPTQLADFLLADCFRMAIAQSRYDDGLLVQIARGPTFQDAAGRLETIVALLPEASTHIWFHPDGAVLDLPIYDRSAVLTEYRNPSKPENIDDSEFAKAGWQEFIDEHPNFDDSPIFLERTADRQTTILENRPKDLRVDWSLAETLEDVYLSGMQRRVVEAPGREELEPL